MVKLTDVKGIGPATIEVLLERKIKTVEALAAISLAELQKIPGFKGDLRARAVKKSAADCLQGKAGKQASAAGGGVQTVVKKTAASPAVSRSAADKVKDKDKQKTEKDGKKKVKDKEKKKKNKDKKKGGKKKDKKKS